MAAPSRQQQTNPQARLRRFLRPASIALVGATERSLWSNAAHDNLTRFGFGGRIHLVNPRGGQIYGRPAATSCRALGEIVDAALLMVPEASLADAIGDLAESGVSGAVVLSAGFAELGEAGAERQREVAAAARRSGIRLLGPNCLGFVNFTESAPLWTTPLRRPMADQTVAVVSQSGATAGQLAIFAYQQRVGLTHMISTGNEADIDIAEAIAFLAAQEKVRAIAVFMESARRPEAFIAAVRTAQQAGKPVVVLKVGASQAAAQAAQAHTGSLVGDDRVFNAVCHRLGVPRVQSLEDLIGVADLMARVGPIEPQGLALVGMSGGMIEIATDAAEQDRVAMPVLATSTLARLAGILPAYATPSNPLDVTGGAMLKPQMLEHALAAIGQDPAIGLVTFIFDAPPKIETAGVGRAFLRHVGAGLLAAGKPSLMLSHNFVPVTGDARTMVDEAAITYSGMGLSHGIAAIAHLFAWSRARRSETSAPSAISPSTARPVTERETLAYLATAAVPVIPGLIATSPEAAIAEAARHDGNVALKIASPDILHKTEVGGVALNLTGAEQVRDAWHAMMRRVRATAPDARIDGIIVSPMRKQGVELLVGTLRDPQWGPVIAIGFGGVLVELLRDSSLRLLPVSEAQVLEMLAELRGAALLDGYRGASPVDRGRLAQVIAAIGRAALALGPDLVSLEVNPLLAHGDRIEALDALAVWAAP